MTRLGTHGTATQLDATGKPPESLTTKDDFNIDPEAGKRIHDVLIPAGRR